MPRGRNQFGSLKQRILAVRAHGKSLDPGDQVTAELAKYLCVLASGLVEAKIRTAVADAVSQSKPREVVGNAAKAFALTIQNPNFERLVNVVRKLDGDVASRIGQLDKSEHSEALNSIMSNRHLIAHGRDCCMSFRQVCTYIDALERIFSEIDRLL